MLVDHGERMSCPGIGEKDVTGATEGAHGIPVAVVVVIVHAHSGHRTASHICAIF
jgi:hypothetical protein